MAPYTPGQGSHNGGIHQGIWPDAHNVTNNTSYKTTEQHNTPIDNTINALTLGDVFTVLQLLLPEILFYFFAVQNHEAVNVQDIVKNDAATQREIAA